MEIFATAGPSLDGLAGGIGLGGIVMLVLKFMEWRIGNAQRSSDASKAAELATAVTRATFFEKRCQELQEELEECRGHKP